MDAIDGLQDIRVTIPEVARVLRLMEAINQSAATKQIVPFE